MGTPQGSTNNTKCKVLHLGWGNSQYQHSLEDEQIESSLGEKDLGLLVDERLDMTQPCALTAQRDKGVLGCLQSSVASRAREGILSLCSSLHSLEDEQIESSLGEKDLGLLVDERLDMTQPCALTAQRDKGVLGCLQSSVASRAREGILSLCSSLIK
ncbi:hypothetical protein HGM15179_008706 [Zosterops borbonicus]|uniref:Uncharacterized protein n=1 Tax=Zosterops borbonicus TaxID=364589 RepID=A0A8K1GIJ9_9PASS|nr:hypothetical protein HGM15179_008706 [Zosterops borbonicus]